MSGLSLDAFIPLSVIAASFLASPHCVGMCGPLVLGLGKDRSRLIAYHVGRLVSYASLGALAGWLGNSIFSSLALPWLNLISVTLMALMFIYMGWRTFTGKPLHFAILPAVKWAWIKKLPRIWAAGVGGVFTGFLPCGHLHAFLLGALASGSTARGAAFMFAFWLGTLPALGFGIGWLHAMSRYEFANRALRSRLAGVLFIACGLLSVYGFASRLQTSASPSVAESHSHHHH